MNVLQNLIELYDHLPIDSTYRSVVRKILMNLEQAAEANLRNPPVQPSGG